MTASTATARTPSSAGWYLKSVSRSVTTGAACAPGSGGVGYEVTDDHEVGHLVHLGTPVHRLGLQESPCFLLVLPVPVHEYSLGPVDHLAGLEPLGQVADLGLEARQLRVAPERDFD